MRTQPRHLPEQTIGRRIKRAAPPQVLCRGLFERKRVHFHLIKKLRMKVQAAQHPEAAELVQISVPAGLRSADALAGFYRRPFADNPLHFIGSGVFAGVCGIIM